MEEKSKKFYLWMFIIGMVIVTILIIVFIISLRNNLNKDDMLEEKVNEEVSYLDNSLISIMNNINNISSNNYVIETQEVSTGGSESKSSKESSNSKDGKEGEQANEGSQNQSSEGSESKSGDEEESNVIYQLKRSGILTGKEIDWEETKTSIENLYPVWTTIEIDLNKQDADTKETDKFNQELDLAIMDSKAKDKEKVVTDLGTLYDILTNIIVSYSKDDSQISKYKFKNNIVKSYSDVESGNWEAAKKAGEEISTNFKDLKLNNTISDKKIEEYSLVRIDKLITQLKDTLEKNDKDLYYIKYKMLIEEVNLI